MSPDREVMGLNPSRVIPKLYKNVRPCCPAGHSTFNGKKAPFQYKVAGPMGIPSPGIIQYVQGLLVIRLKNQLFTGLLSKLVTQEYLYNTLCKSQAV
jgi:hypothetical protein